MTDEPRTADDRSLLDTTGWSSAGTDHWRNPRGGELQITSSGDSVELSNLELFRDRMRREILSRGGGLISADVSPVPSRE